MAASASPPATAAAVGIEKKAVLLGMGDKFELWSEQGASRTDPSDDF